MKILTFIKHVPDSRAGLKFKADGSGVEAAGVRFVCDPFDEFGVEFAVRTKEARTDVEVIAAVAIGPDAVVESLRHAVAMGADRAIHAKADAHVSWDDIGAARIAAGVVREKLEGFDLLLCGKQSTDGDAEVFGPALAEMLGIPHVGAVTSIEIASDGRSLTARRRIEGAEEVVRCSLPALLTCEKGLVEPRQPALPKMMKAKKHPIEVASADAAPGPVRLASIAAPSAKSACRMIEGDPPAMARELVRLLREEAKVL